MFLMSMDINTGIGTDAKDKFPHLLSYSLNIKPMPVGS